MTGPGLPKGQDDGSCKYESAHLEGVASEKIVRSEHSTQSIPATILEVRRILYEHLGIACGLECEVPDRVDAAVAGAPKPEPPAVTPDRAKTLSEPMTPSALPGRARKRTAAADVNDPTATKGADES